MSISTISAREALAPSWSPSVPTTAALEVTGPSTSARRTAPARSAERIGTFIVPLLTYLWLGHRIASAGLVPGDALTRTANASATLLSRDPHLEALGFVWSPLPAFAQIPLIPIGRLWRPIITEGMGSVIVSAVFTAWMLTAIRRWLQDAGLRRSSRLALVALLALHPLVLLTASNGMSESALMCFLALTALHLSRWCSGERAIDLVRTGIAVGFAYLSRYEAVGAIVGVVSLVGIVTYVRARDRGRAPWPDVRLRCAVVGLPPLAAFAVWALVSWAIVGEPFGHFTSNWGNSGQVTAARAGIEAATGGASGLPRAGYFALQLLLFGGAAVAAATFLVWWGTKGGERVAVAVAAFGTPLGFHLAGAVTGSTFPFARFAICVAPLGVLLAGTVIVNLAGRGVRPAPALVIAITTVATVIALSGVRGGHLYSPVEAGQLSAVPAPYGTTGHAPTETIVSVGRRIARDIDSLDPAHGEVLLDEATLGSMAIVLNAPDQRDYVIDSDRDFQRAVSDPGTWGVRYLLIPDPRLAGFDALHDQYPTLYENGGGISHLVRQWESAETANYRLYELDPEQRVR